MKISKSLYLVKENIPYEKDNIWIVAADNETDAVNMVIEYNSVASWNISTTRLSNVSDYYENEIIHSL